MTASMKWGRASKRRQIGRQAVNGMVGDRPVDPDVHKFQAKADARYYAALRRRKAEPATITIRAACEQSTRLRKVGVTLPRLKFLEGDNG